MHILLLLTLALVLDIGSQALAEVQKIEPMDTSDFGVLLRATGENHQYVITDEKNYKTLFYKDDTQRKLGGGAIYKNLLIGWDVSLGGQKTRSKTLFLDYYGKNFFAEVSYQRVVGFTLHNEDAKDPGEIWENRGSGLFRNDLAITAYGFNVYYVFFSDQYSIRAANTFTERQTSWGWSPLVSLGHMSNLVYAKSSLIPASHQDEMAEIKDFDGGIFTTTTLSGGLALHVPYDVFFFDLNGLVGSGIQLRRYTVDNSKPAEADEGRAYKFLFHMSAGMNQKLYYVAVKAFSDNTTTFTKKFQTNYLSHYFSLVAGRRF
jgi:hypothetical protein